MDGKPKEIRAARVARQLRALLLAEEGFAYDPDNQRRTGAQGRIATHCKVDPSWLSRTLEGVATKKGPDFDKLKKVAKAYGKTLREVFPDEEDELAPAPSAPKEDPAENFSVGQGEELSEDEKAVLRWMRRLASSGERGWLRIIRNVESPRPKSGYPSHKGKA